MLTLSLALTLAACGAEKKSSGGGAASGLSYFSTYDGYCVLVTPETPYTDTQLEAINADAEEGMTPFKEGSCPNSVTVGTEKATVVKTCDAIENEDDEGHAISSRTTVYSKATFDDSVQDVSPTLAAAICEGIVNESNNDTDE